ncbi:AVN_HP_G0119920.mRNA.1.CDS.1 [Saccharomyces cerevisiae]|nr:AVN_HP_G0119920.mRNA.1.CDS.1 [Saccharomyces cerevisiae]CAI6997024.1 AVN_HP_G0119920.mRNA.1.CDS.1 [Saccharomyces cerevisiae]
MDPGVSLYLKIIPNMDKDARYLFRTTDSIRVIYVLFKQLCCSFNGSKYCTECKRREFTQG